MTSVDALPDDAESLKRLLLAREAELAAAREHAATAAAEAAALRAKAAGDQALIAHLKSQIEKLRRDRFGQRSELLRREAMAFGCWDQGEVGQDLVAALRACGEPGLQCQ